MKILYIDCISGISGDMFIGALIDAGANPNYLAEELKKLQIEEEYELKWTRTIKNGITGTKFDVVLTGHQPHSHTPSAFKVLGSHHHHDNRTYRHIVGMIEATGFEEQVKDIALRIFKKIGEAEARIHGIPLDQVHFHEVGAVDSIIDIVGAAILIDHMNIAKIICSPIPVGSGKIRIDHGIYPVPAPATLEILKGVPLEQSNI